MASGRRVVLVFDDVVQRPLGSYPTLSLLEVFQSYVFRMSSVPNGARKVDIALGSSSS
jgi:hypothetical protein